MSIDAIVKLADKLSDKTMTICIDVGFYPAFTSLSLRFYTWNSSSDISSDHHIRVDGLDTSDLLMYLHQIEHHGFRDPAEHEQHLIDTAADAAREVA